LEVDGVAVTVADRGASLLEVLREDLGVRSAKDGCSPQGQCGCCTVLVDGSPRVACVTPARRVAGRSITTLEGLGPEVTSRWAAALTATGGSQCGFCTPGIIVRLESLRARTSARPVADAGPSLGDEELAAVGRALQAHLCRCTGWRTVVDAYARVVGGDPIDTPTGRDPQAAASRAGLEGGWPQAVGASVALGQGGFAADSAPPDALVAVPDGAGGWAVAETLAEARLAAGKVQGRRTTAPADPPLAVPDGAWDLTLRTSWVEPGYLEPDASWCRPGGEPVSPLANGGAFGGKADSLAPAVARRLADRHGRPVLVLFSREDVVRLGPKRPPLAAGVRADGTGLVHVVSTPGIAERIRSAAPGFEVVEVDHPGPPTSARLRGAGWAEASVLLAAVTGAPSAAVTPDGARAQAEIAPDGTIRVRVAAGDPLDDVVLASYVTGAAHQALSWVTSEALAVDAQGTVHDLTIRSFGILRAIDTPPVEVEIDRSAAERSRPAVAVSDAVLVAVALAVWRAQGCPPSWPTRQVPPVGLPTA
jgi:xanthine dehydrogenase small subunit